MPSFYMMAEHDLKWHLVTLWNSTEIYQFIPFIGIKTSFTPCPENYVREYTKSEIMLTKKLSTFSGRKKEYKVLKEPRLCCYVKKKWKKIMYRIYIRWNCDNCMLKNKSC